MAKDPEGIDASEIRSKYLDGLKKYTQSKLAEDLKARYGKKPAPVAKAVAPKPQAEADVDLASLDEGTISQLLGE